MVEGLVRVMVETGLVAVSAAGGTAEAEAAAGELSLSFVLSLHSEADRAKKEASNFSLYPEDWVCGGGDAEEEDYG